MKATLSHSPLAFAVYMQWYPLYHEVISIIGERPAYLFAHAISEASNCPLCTTFFRKIIIEHPEDLNLTEAEQHLLDFGSEIARNRGEVSDAVYGPQIVGHRTGAVQHPAGPPVRSTPFIRRASTRR